MLLLQLIITQCFALYTLLYGNVARKIFYFGSQSGIDGGQTAKINWRILVLVIFTSFFIGMKRSEAGKK